MFACVCDTYAHEVCSLYMMARAIELQVHTHLHAHTCKLVYTCMHACSLHVYACARDSYPSACCMIVALRHDHNEGANDGAADDDDDGISC